MSTIEPGQPGWYRAMWDAQHQALGDNPGPDHTSPRPEPGPGLSYAPNVHTLAVLPLGHGTDDPAFIAEWLRDNTLNAYEEHPDQHDAERMAAALLAYVHDRRRTRPVGERRASPQRWWYQLADSPKAVGETARLAQAVIAEAVDDCSLRRAHLELLGRLASECDRHRPLGSDGRHGDLHTGTCGCHVDTEAGSA